ncbi:unnamed protein product [Penicillium viridicatum]
MLPWPTAHPTTKLFLEEKERRKQAEERTNQAKERRRQEEERRNHAEDEGRLDRERNRPTTFVEFVRLYHNLLSRPLRVELPSSSTTGTIPLSTGKYCPSRLEVWTDCSARQQGIYTSVCKYLQPAEEDQARLFTPLNSLEENAKQFGYRSMSSEQAVENCERNAVENYVHNIIQELCSIDAAREEFGLGDGIKFENHTNLLEADEGVEASEGLEYSYVTTGIAHVLLRIPHDNPSTPYYHFCDPNSEVDPEAENGFQEPKTSIARVLCLCLMAFRSSIRDHEWRSRARQNPRIWTSNFSRTHSKVTKRPQPLPNSDSTYLEYSSLESGPAYEPSSVCL